MKGMSQFGFRIYIYGNVTVKFPVLLSCTNKMSFFLFYKNGEQEGKTGPWGIDSSGREEDIRKGCRR
jgi:hypothetical protein